MFRRWGVTEFTLKRVFRFLWLELHRWKLMESTKICLRRLQNNLVENILMKYKGKHAEVARWQYVSTNVQSAYYENCCFSNWTINFRKILNLFILTLTVGSALRPWKVTKEPSWETWPWRKFTEREKFFLKMCSSKHQRICMRWEYRWDGCKNWHNPISWSFKLTEFLPHEIQGVSKRLLKVWVSIASTF